MIDKCFHADLKSILEKNLIAVFFDDVCQKEARC